MSRPNLLFFLTDQQRYDTMACYGNDQIHTPNLNRLSDQSLCFEHAYVIQWHNQDGHPVPGEAEVNPAIRTPWRSVITPDRWKLNVSAHDQCELYDLNADPAELTNLFDDPQQQDRVNALTRLIVEWQATFGDSAPLP